MFTNTLSAVRLALLLFAICTLCSSNYAQEMLPVRYDIGAPVLQDIWVHPQNGNDNAEGTKEKPLQSVRAAWAKIPPRQELSATGYRIMLLPGTYTEQSIPNYWEERWGTATYPIIITAAEGRGTVRIETGFNIADCRYLYIMNLVFDAPLATADVVHFQMGHHYLLRNCSLRAHRDNTQECLKVNQSQYVYIEDCDIQNVWDNAVDYVAVQYGHFVGNKVHDCGDWAMYVKGGSAYYRVEANEFYRAGTGGFTAGQGTGAQYMTLPWLHYEAYDIKFINNIIHNCEGAAFGVNGGYNILLAYNTAYRCGRRSHIFESVFGARSCDGQPGSDFDSCARYISYGGWANTRTADGDNYTRIPNKNVYVFNNIIYNPQGYQSQYQHFFVAPPYSGEFQNGSNVPTPTLSDEQLLMKGNIIWNGPKEHPFGVGGDDNGCRDNNPTCNETQLKNDNRINEFEPKLIDPDNGNFAPAVGGTVLDYPSVPLPSFPGNDRPTLPLSPPGIYSNTILRDRNGYARKENGVTGALTQEPVLTVEETHNALWAIRCSTEGKTLVIEAQSPHSGCRALHLYTIQGICLATISEGWSGEERRRFSYNASLAAGLYLIVMRTPLGVIAEKLIVAQ